ncbi:MAG: alkaline phosphatase family protein [Atribacterota bacterium]
MSKVIVFGIDGASYDFIKKYIKNLPYFKKIKQKGTLVRLKSVIPPVTAPAWSASYTGMNPGKSGICGMFHINKNNYTNIILNASDRKSKDIYEIASEQTKKCLILGMPYTYPPRKLNGLLISGRFTAGGYPEEEAKKLMAEYDYRLYAGKPPSVNYVKKELDRRFKMYKELLEKYEWDLAMLGIEHIDSIGHDMFYENESAVLDVYKIVDRKLKEISDKVGSDRIFIFSDHGFCSFEKRFYLPRWLVKENLMKIKKSIEIKETERKVRKEKLEKLRRKSKNYLFYLMKVLFYKAKQLARKRFPNLKYPNFLRQFSRFAQVDLYNEERPIDYSKSKAFMATQTISNYGGIFINTKDNYSQGIVENQDYSEVIKNIKNYLYELKDSKTNNRIVERVYTRNELVSGPYSKYFPDVLFRCRKSIYVSDSMFNIEKGDIIENLPVANHDINGVFGSFGKDIIKNKRVECNIKDIMPTILYGLNLKVPKGLDGRVLEDIYKEEYLTENPVEYAEMETESKQKRKHYTQDEEEEVKKRLKDLGYID